MGSADELIAVCAGADAAEAEKQGFQRLLLCLGLDTQGVHRFLLHPHSAGCFLGLSDLGLTAAPSSRIISALADEVKRVGAVGLFADFERRTPAVCTFLGALDRLFAQEGLTLLVPLAQAETVSHALLLTETAISGGCLETYLRELIAAYPHRIAASLRPVSADFTLPATDSEGKALSDAERDSLCQRTGAQCYYSHELCAKYFTYMDAQQNGHFVLYDDSSTLTAKMQLLHRLEIRHCFALWPDVRRLSEYGSATPPQSSVR